jgi:antitoxin component of MazEF toxin-antitoxin module
VARKEDGFYIDPRTNGGKNIEAITLDDVVITDGNGSIISRHAKRQNDDSDEHVVEEIEDENEKEYVAKESQDEGKTDDKKDKESVTGEENLSEDENTRRKRREVAVSKDNEGDDSKKSEVHPVSIFRSKKL